MFLRKDRKLPIYRQVIFITFAVNCESVQDNRNFSKGILAGNLRRLRKAANLTQMQLSLDSGVVESQIAGIEQGTRNPTISTLDKIADALNCSTHELLKL